MHAASFAPVADARARVLILGSLPGAMSLALQQYYAQPHNAFWRIMGELAGAGPGLPYADRLERLKAAGIALWDVCASAFRPGSLDAAIDRASVAANDIAGFLAAHPHVALIGFNGATAARLFSRHVLPHLPDAARAIRRTRLPSTSPAHAAMLFQDKLRAWRLAITVDRLPPRG